MKRIIAAILVLLIAASTAGCSDGAESATANFYYRSADPEYHTNTSVIQSESRRLSVPLSDLNSILQLYLAGPDSPHLVSPFPEGTKLINVQAGKDITEVVLSDEIASVSGVDLMIACACLSTTLLEISQSDTIQIRAETLSLGAQDYIEMDSQSILSIGSQ